MRKSIFSLNLLLNFKFSKLLNLLHIHNYLYIFKKQESNIKLMCINSNKIKNLKIETKISRLLLVSMVSFILISVT